VKGGGGRGRERERAQGKGTIFPLVSSVPERGKGVTTGTSSSSLPRGKQEKTPLKKNGRTTNVVAIAVAVFLDRGQLILTPLLSGSSHRSSSAMSCFGSRRRVQGTFGQACNDRLQRLCCLLFFFFFFFFFWQRPEMGYHASRFIISAAQREDRSDRSELDGENIASLYVDNSASRNRSIAITSLPIKDYSISSLITCTINGFA